MAEKQLTWLAQQELLICLLLLNKSLNFLKPLYVHLVNGDIRKAAPNNTLPERFLLS